MIDPEIIHNRIEQLLILTEAANAAIEMDKAHIREMEIKRIGLTESVIELRKILQSDIHNT